MDEANAALARKQHQHEAIVKRAEEAEAAQVKVQSALDEQKSKCEALELKVRGGGMAFGKGPIGARNRTLTRTRRFQMRQSIRPIRSAFRCSPQVEEQEQQIELTRYFVDERARTEERLGGQAREVLQFLEMTEMEAGALHTLLSDAAAKIAAQGELRDGFAASSEETLAELRAQLQTLSHQLGEQRAASLEAAKEAQRTRQTHSARMAELANGLAGAGEEEISRAASVLRSACEEAGAALGAAADALQQQSTAIVTAAADAQGAVGANLEKIGSLLAEGEAALTGWVEKCEARRATTAADFKSKQDAVGASVQSAAKEAISRLELEQQRLASHGVALQQLLREVESSQGHEERLRQAHSELAAEHKAARSAAETRMVANSTAVGAAAKAQQEGQRDTQVASAIETASKELEEMSTSVSAALDAQAATLSGALEKQRAGNKIEEAKRRIGELQGAVDEAAAARAEEMKTQQDALAAQQAKLQALMEAQSSQREQMRAALMAGMEKMLAAELEKLSASASEGIESAVQASQRVSAACEHTASSISEARDVLEGRNKGLLEVTGAWNESNLLVAGQLEQALASRASAAECMAGGKDAVAKSQEAAAAEAAEWARSDAKCREELEQVVTCNAQASEKAAAAADAQNSRLEAAAELGDELTTKSVTVHGQVSSAITDTALSGKQLDAAQKAGEAAAESQRSELKEVAGWYDVRAAAEGAALAGLIPERAAELARVEALRGDARAKGDAAAKEMADAMSGMEKAAVAALSAQGERWAAFASTEGARGEAVGTKLQEGRLAVGKAADEDSSTSSVAAEAAVETATKHGGVVDAAVSAQDERIGSLQGRVSEFVATSNVAITRGPNPSTLRSPPHAARGGGVGPLVLWW